ncbi:MAG: hypothetical protein PVF82_08585 [Gammaproteobacteria bacterium]|jgi:hypothetical protein
MTTSLTRKRPDSGTDNPKLIRDTFSMPDSDYQLIAELLERSPAMAARSTKSEIVRAGLKVLHNMDDDDLSQVLTQVRRLKTGRPAKRSKSGVR